MNWIATKNKLPKNGQRVIWIEPNSGIEVKGYFGGRLWHRIDGTYVYYRPEFWRDSLVD